MRFYLVYILLGATLASSLGQLPQQEECQNITLTNSNASIFYKITKLRKFKDAFPEWILFLNGSLYYNLNKVTFKAEENQQDDSSVLNIKPPGSSSADVDKIQVYQQGFDGYIFLEKRNQVFKLAIDDNRKERELNFLIDPVSQVIFVLSKPPPSELITPQQLGKLFWFSIKRIASKNDSIITYEIPFFGDTISSINMDSITRDIYLGAKKNKIGYVYMLKQQATEPCTANYDLEKVLKTFLNTSFKAFEDVILNRNGILKCSNSIRNPNHIKACQRVKDYEKKIHSPFADSVKLMIETNKDMMNQIEEQKVLIDDAINKLHRILKTAILNRERKEIFTEKLAYTEVDEFSASKYVCITREELEQGEKDLDIQTELESLKDGLYKVRDDLDGTPDILDSIFKDAGEQEAIQDIFQPSLQPDISIYQRNMEP